jgi:pSer/pThr/pTyr-binding forkhead associated (FHA) protein
MALREYITQEGYFVEGKARIALRTNPDLRRGKFDIDCRNITPEAAVPEAPATPAPVLTAVPSAFDRPPAVLSLPNGQRIELHEGHYILGRHLENDIVLNDTNVSRRHAEFVCAAGEVVVRDLGSTNGTKVNGVLITGEQLLQHGDVVNFGTAQVRFEAS